MHAGSEMKTGISSLSVIDTLLVLVVVIWGVNFTLVKIALMEMNPLVFNCFRVIIASVFLIILSCFKKNSRPNRQTFLQLSAIGLIGNGIYQVLFILGIYRTAAGVTALILAATPIFVMIIDSILHVEKIGYREWVGVIFSFIGITLMIHIESLGSVSNSALIGDLLILVGTVCWASYIALSKPLLSSISPLQFVTYTVILGSPIVIFASLPSILSLDLRTVSWENWSIVGYSAILSIAVAYIIWYSSVQRIGTTRTAIYQNLVPLIAVVIAWQILGEQLITRQLLGGAMIFLGIYLTRFSK